MAQIITLTTDFGLSDHYVAAVKGAILSVNPTATIVDISHDILPQRVKQGAFLLECALPYFPRGTAHLAVIDPGVGTERRALAISNGNAVFVGPDNGLLSCALPENYRRSVAKDGDLVKLSDGIEAFVLSERRFHRQSVSGTFHGRDVFAPVAAHLSLGVPMTELGQEIQAVVALAPFLAAAGPDGTMVGEVVHIDRFGNAITTIRSHQAPASVTIEIRGYKLAGLAQTYASLLGPGALTGSSGFIEIASAGSSAARELGIELGDRVVARPG